MVTCFNPDDIAELTALDWERVGSRLEQSDLDWIVECMCRGNFNLEDRAVALAEEVKALADECSDLEATADHLAKERDDAREDLADAEDEISRLKRLVSQYEAAHDEL